MIKSILILVGLLVLAGCATQQSYSSKVSTPYQLTQVETLPTYGRCIVNNSDGSTTITGQPCK